MVPSPNHVSGGTTSQMHLRAIDTSSDEVTITGAAHSSSLSFEHQVQNGLNLILPMKSPAQMKPLMLTVASVMDDVHRALTDLHYPHFARFLPMPDGSALAVITSYDGELTSYIMDFVAVLGGVFDAILPYIRGAPPLPVERYPRAFVDFVRSHDMTLAGVWSAYPDVTVLDVLLGDAAR